MSAVEISLLLPFLHHALPLPAHQEAPVDGIIGARSKKRPFLTERERLDKEENVAYKKG